ncbi:hypothetical protein HDU76_004555 [Blyttiomyces sp. JEL0837]|nr:hypothetical protein HDU76_004555 [Blyttiomyces sp. JEL0837]
MGWSKSTKREVAKTFVINLPCCWKGNKKGKIAKEPNAESVSSPIPQHKTPTARLSASSEMVHNEKEWDSMLSISQSSASRSSDLIHENVYLNDQISYLRHRYTTLETRYQAREDELGIARQELDDARGLVEAGLVDRETLEGEVKIRESVVEGLEIELKKLRVEVDTGREETVKLEEKLSNAISCLDVERETRLAVERELKEKEEQLVAKGIQFEESKQELLNAKALVEAGDAKKADLGFEIKMSKIQVDGLKNEVVRLTAEVDGGREELGKLRAEKGEFDARLENERDRRVTMEKLLEERSKQFQENERELGDCQDSLAVARRESSAWKTRLFLEQEKTSGSDKVKQLEQLVEKLKNEMKEKDYQFENVLRQKEEEHLAKLATLDEQWSNDVADMEDEHEYKSNQLRKCIEKQRMEIEELKKASTTVPQKSSETQTAPVELQDAISCTSETTEVDKTDIKTDFPNKSTVTAKIASLAPLARLGSPVKDTKSTKAAFQETFTSSGQPTTQINPLKIDGINNNDNKPKCAEEPAMKDCHLHDNRTTDGSPAITQIKEKGLRGNFEGGYLDRPKPSNNNAHEIHNHHHHNNSNKHHNQAGRRHQQNNRSHDARQPPQQPNIDHNAPGGRNQNNYNNNNNNNHYKNDYGKHRGNYSNNNYNTIGEHEYGSTTNIHNKGPGSRNQSDRSYTHNNNNNNNNTNNNNNYNNGNNGNNFQGRAHNQQPHHHCNNDNRFNSDPAF